MKRRTLLGALTCTSGAALVSAVPGCGPEPVPDRRRELMRSWGENFLLAEFSTFVERLGVLEQRAKDLKSDPTRDNLVAARQAWFSARAPWKRTEVFKFGPVEDQPLRYGPKIDFWPARPDDVDAVLESDEEIVPEDLGAGAKGLPAVEYLLYGDGALAAFQDDSRRHEYLEILVRDLIVQTEGLADAWDPEGGNFLGELLDAGGDSELYDTLSMALSEIVNQMAFTIENMRADKLESGIAPDGTPRPDKLESHFSGRSIRDMKDNLRGIEILYFGDESRGVQALDAYLVHRGYHLAGRVQEALTAARQALDELDLPLSVAVEEAPDEMATALERLEELQRLIQLDVIAALSLSVGFSENDGD